MKQILKPTRRCQTRRAGELARMPLRMPRVASRDMVAYAAVLEILG